MIGIVWGVCQGAFISQELICSHVADNKMIFEGLLGKAARK